MKAINLHPQDIQLLPEGGGWLLAEFGGGNKSESDASAEACMDALRQTANPPTMKLFDDPEEEKMIWKVRESGLGATAHVPNKKITWKGWEDAAVPPDKVGDYLRNSYPYRF
jgi:FAD/FMN-containing dehydrogenase